MKQSARGRPILLFLGALLIGGACRNSPAAPPDPGEDRSPERPGRGKVAAANGKAIQALRIEQLTSGIPDPRPGKPSRQVRQIITIAESGDRLVFEQMVDRGPGGGPPEPEMRHVLRLDRDPPVIWQMIGPDFTSYREFRGDLNKHQRDRDIYERSVLVAARRMNRKERRRILEQHHLRAKGHREIVVTRGDRKQFLGRQCQRLVVTENGRQIIDAYVSDEVAGGQRFFDLYRRLGAFSSQVLEQLESIRGLPLKASITVVTRLPAYKLDVEVKKIEEVQVDPAFFETGSAKKIEDTPQLLRCPECGRDVERDKAVKWRRLGKLLHFCSPECKRVYDVKHRLRPLKRRTKKEGSE